MDFALKGCTLHEALAALEDDEDADPVSVFITPPDPAVVTDEDSADEDEGGLVNNLSGRQLNARCEVRLASKKNKQTRRRVQSLLSDRENKDEHEGEPVASGSRSVRGRRIFCGHRGRVSSSSRGRRQQLTHDSESQSDETSEDQDEGPSSKQTKKSPKSWIHEDISQNATVFPKGDYSKYRNKTPTEMLELFFDKSFYEFLLTESQKYAAFLNCPDPKITLDELVVFISILINSGYNTVPSKIHYWDQHDDMRNHMVYNCMRRDRFKTIMRFLHCADNTQLDNIDKIWKLRPIINFLKKKFQENYVPTANLNYDESMIEYFGRHGCKQFIRGKPIRFGFKNWCLNTPSGYLLDFEIYQGKNPNENTSYDKLFGKAASPLIRMIDNMPQAIQSLPMSFYFDNLFTSFQLLCELQKRGYQGTGTVRENRLPKDIPLIKKNDMKKTEPRGTYVYTKSKEDGVIVVRWKDNSVVTCMSSAYGVEPLTNVGRYSSSEKKKIQVPRPSIFTNYNRYMGGTDLMDQNVNTYRIGFRSKKWWWPIFTYLIDVTICNAWVLSKGTGNNMSQLNFRRHIVQTYLLKFRSVPSTGGRPSTSKFSRTGNRVPDEIRFDGMGHLLVPCEGGSRRKCALEVCKSQTRAECRKCNVGLCLSCNAQFHT